MVRIKHRYLVVRILYPATQATVSKSIVNHSNQDLLNLYRPSPQSLDTRNLFRLIRTSIEYMYGDYGVGLVLPSLKITYFSSATSTAILRVARAHYRILWGALSWITSLGQGGSGGDPCVFRVVRVSGTIRKAEEDVINRAKAEIRRAKGQPGSGTQEGLAMLLGPEVGIDGERAIQPGKGRSNDTPASDDEEDSGDESAFG